MHSNGSYATRTYIPHTSEKHPSISYRLSFGPANGTPEPIQYRMPGRRAEELTCWLDTSQRTSGCGSFYSLSSNHSTLSIRV